MSNADHLPDATPAAEHKARPGSSPPPLPGLWRGVIVGLLGLILVAVAVVGLALYADNRSSDAERADATLSEFARHVAEACAANPLEARKLGIECGKAKEIDERPVGEKGDPGAKGEPGDRGPKGETGATGARGPQGVPGESPPCLLQANRCVGATGAVGAVGPRGPIGPQGIPGKPGEDGAPGETGPAGAKGETGTTGPKGDAGATGPKGDPGEAGPIGAVGPIGPAGPKGDQGEPGPTCPPGSTLQKQQVLTTEAPVAGIWILACVLDDQNP